MRERINAKTGMTDAQGAEVAKWLESAFDALRTDAMPYQWARQSGKGESFRPCHSLRIAPDREIHVYNQEQASNLHRLVTGETLGNLPAPKRQTEYRYPVAYDVDRDADAIMRVYGHPLYCVAAIERQLDWYWQQTDEDRKRMRPLGNIYQIADRLRMRADGVLVKTTYGRRGFQSTSVTPYNLDAAMRRLCPEHAKPELVTV